MAKELYENSLNDINKILTQAFLKFENYLDRISNDYEYFGFYEWIVKFLDANKKQEKFEVGNYKRVADYWFLIDYYRQKMSKDYIRENVHSYNGGFLDDCNELLLVSAALFDDFIEFDLDKDPLNKRSIKDIIHKENPNIYVENDVSDSKTIEFNGEPESNKHSNIFVNNAFAVWQSMFDEFGVNERSRTDVKFMFEEMKSKKLIHETINQKNILEWINSTYQMTIEKTSNYSRIQSRLKAFERAYARFKK